MTRRLSFNEVKSEFEKRGYLLLESEYVNNTTKMRYQCPIHHNKETGITIKDLRYGHGCPYCAGLAKPTYEEVKNEFKKCGYSLLDTTYANATSKLRYKCPNHPNKKLSITLNKLRLGRRCPHCSAEKAMESRKGGNHHNWKGGVTELKDFLRNSDATKEWKRESLREYGYKCFVTGKNSKTLEVHHVKPFNLIRYIILKNLGLEKYDSIGNYSEDELKAINNEYAKIHAVELGIPLEKDIHKKFHAQYGYQTTINDLMEFKKLREHA